MRNQRGIVHILILIAVLGLLAFLLIANLGNFKDKIFSTLFPKPISNAQTSNEKGEVLPEYISNQILVKVKKEARGKVKENATDTGIASINKLNAGKDPKAKFDFKVKGFEKVGKVGKNSNLDAELFSWYLLTLDEPGLIATGKLDQASAVIVANPSSTNAKGFKGGTNPGLAKLQELVSNLKKDPDVADVSLNYIVSTQAIPNDPYYSSIGSWGQTYDDLYGLKKINAAGAWDQTTGSAYILVAGIDTGIDRNHPDIAANMWVNSAETPNNNIDDDGNGFIDDYYGWDFANNDNDPMDDHGHGSHTVGTIAGVGNNGTGVVGVNWTSKIMALKFLDSQGSGFLSNGVRALQYAADMGARVSSNSWGGGGTSQMMDDAVKYEHDKGMVAVFAAGNNNGDSLDFNPASADYAITVAASDSNDAKASFSNWGEKIDVAAPGVDILSIRASNNPMCTAARTVGTNYCRVSGTSMATPHVAGLAALILSKNPNLTNEEVRQILRTGADDLGTQGKDSSFGYGRINAANSINLANTHPLTPVITSPSSRTLVNASSVQVTGMVGGTNFASYKLEMGLGRTPTAWTTLSTSTSQPTTNTTLASFDPTQLTDGKYTIKLTVTDTAGKNYQFQIFDVEVDNFDNSIIFPVGSVSLSSVDVYGTALTKNGLGFGSYKLEWSSNGGSTWSTSGVTLVSNGSQPINGGKLGTWDTSGLTNGSYHTLRLSVTAVNGIITTSTSTVNADKDLVAGWPKTISSLNALSYTSPVLADLNGDGKKDIIVTGGDGKLYAYQKDGSQLPNFPVSFPADTLYFSVGPNVADLDNDGQPEILAQAITTAYTSKLYIVKSDGSLYPSWPTTAMMGFGTPTVADLDGDGTKDIVTMKVTTWQVETDFDLHAYHLNGTELTGFPKHIVAPPIGFDAGQIFPVSAREVGPLTIADLEHDGAVEIGFIFSDRFYLFDNQGNVLPGWPFIVPPTNGNNYYVFDDMSFSSGDLDGDGNLELFAQNNYTCSFIGGNLGGCYAGGNANSLLYAIHKDASVLPGWPKTTASDGFYAATPYPGGGTSPAVADMDGDGKDDVIISDYQSGIRIFTSAGKKVIPNIGAGYTSSAIADVDGDGHLEVANGYYGSVGIYKDNGTAYINKNVGGFINGSLVLGDIDNNGKEEMVAINAPYGLTPGVQVQGVYLWEFNSASPPKYDWPMFGHDPARTGRLVVNGGVTPSPSPCSVGLIGTLGSLVGINTCPTPTPVPTPIPTPIPTPTPSPSPTPLPTIIPTPIPSDTTPPMVSITSLVNGSTITRNASLTITATATDNVAVSKVEFYVDNSLKCTDTTASYTCPTKIAGKPGGAHTITAKAYDSSNNSATNSITVIAK